MNPMTAPSMTDTAPIASAPLGRGGSVVSRLALGTMTFGVETDEAEAHRQLDLFTGRGGTLIDTADVYADGESERIIGRWLDTRARRDDLIIATKGRFAPPPGSRGASRRGLRTAVRRSLERLRVDAIDLYFVHGWDDDTPVRETLATLGDLVAAGTIHDIGWSNVTGWQLQRIVSIAEAEGLPRPVALQPQYNLLDRGIEWELLPCCLAAGLAVTPWSPLGGGWLTGKYSRDRRPQGETDWARIPNGASRPTTFATRTERRRCSRSSAGSPTRADGRCRTWRWRGCSRARGSRACCSGREPRRSSRTTSAPPTSSSIARTWTRSRRSPRRACHRIRTR